MKDPLIVFTHIPKTAGSTVNALIQAAVAGKLTIGGKSVEDAQQSIISLKPAERETVAYVHGHLPYGVHHIFDPRGKRRIRYITMLRDPVERVISQFHFILNHPDHPNHGMFEPAIDAYCEFLKGHRNDNIQTRFISADLRSLTPPHLNAYRARDAEDCLDLACRRLEEDYTFGIQERFDESLPRIAAAAGLRRVPPAYLEMRLREGAEREPATDEERAVIEEMEKPDCRLYRRAVELFVS